MTEASRLKFRNKMVEQIGSEIRLYFQPPESRSIEYPCIVYHYEGLFHLPADNRKYILYDRFTVTAIDKDPDASWHNNLLNLSYSDFDRSYIFDNLNHWVYTIYTK